MRLHDYEIKAIKEYIESLDRDAEVYLFGYRTDDAEKIFRLIDEIDLEDRGTVRDRINRAEKKK